MNICEVLMNIYLVKIIILNDFLYFPQKHNSIKYLQESILLIALDKKPNKSDVIVVFNNKKLLTKQNSYDFFIYIF
jgi:hypothetical protein